MKYQLVFLDPEGRAQAYCGVICRDDAEAARQAKATGYRNEIEIRDGAGHVVRRINARSLRPQSDAA
jgi:hypothetical protein